jgi:hypothetical protein
MENLWPDNKRFAFTIFDDTDVATLGNIVPIYELLTELGIRTTKSVWPLSVKDINSNYTGSQTLEDAQYCEYIKKLQDRGFEIAYHGARMESSERKFSINGLEKFRTELGGYPLSYACHAGNRENLYWGENRFTFKPLRFLFRLLDWSKNGNYEGHIPGSRFFWGDLSKKHIRFARTFSFYEINLFKISNRICYTDPSKPFLNYLFISSDADNVEDFNHMIQLEKQAKLEKEGGVCILSTHLGKGFVKNDAVHPKTQYLLSRLSQRNGWFPTVAQLLEYLIKKSSTSKMLFSEKVKLEITWFLHSLKRKLNSRSYEKSELTYLYPNE